MNSAANPADVLHRARLVLAAAKDDERVPQDVRKRLTDAHGGITQLRAPQAFALRPPVLCAFQVAAALRLILNRGHITADDRPALEAGAMLLDLAHKEGVL